MNYVMNSAKSCNFMSLIMKSANQFFIFCEVKKKKIKSRPNI